MKRFGITAWGLRYVGKDEWVPYCPPVGTGYIKQYWHRKSCTIKYEWYWLNTPDAQYPDTTMRFKVWYPPDMAGNYTSPAASALHIWKMAKIATLSASRAAYHGSHLPTFLVHNPPRYKPGEDHVEVEYGDDSELSMRRDAFYEQMHRQQVTRNEARGAVEQSRAINSGYQGPSPNDIQPVLNSESIREREAREGNGLLDRLVYLDDHRSPVAATAPVLLVDPLEYDKRMDQICSALVDFPVSMLIEQHAQHAGNFDAQVTFARDRMKAIIIQMNADLVEVLLDAKRDALRSEYFHLGRETSRNMGRPLTEAEYRAIHRAVHGLKVEQPCTPLVTVEQFFAIWEQGLIDQEQLADHVAHQTGMNREDMKITPLKRARELEMEQSALAKKQATDSTNLEEEKIEISKQATQDKREIEDGKLKIAASKPKPGAAAKKKAK